jgi:hypothetical protein
MSALPPKADIKTSPLFTDLITASAKAPGSFAMFAPLLRASSRVSGLAADFQGPSGLVL